MDQSELWKLLYGTLNPKRHETPNECLNRLAKEYDQDAHVWLSEESALVFAQQWPHGDLALLERHHFRMHDFDDERPLVVVQRGTRKVIIDGNHRVKRWLEMNEPHPRPVLLVRLRSEVNDS